MQGDDDLWYTPPSSPREWQELERKRLTLIAEQAAMVARCKKIEPPPPEPPQISESARITTHSDPTFFAFFYHHITAAAHHALDHTGLWSHFQLEDITIVGGAVMAIYDVLSNCLPSSVKQTNDIDFAWYIHADPRYPCSHPHAVGQLGDEMIKQIQKQLSHPLVLGHIQRSMGAADSTLGIQVLGKNLVASYGSYAITIRFNGSILAELTLHDGFGSQSYDDQHSPIPYPRAVPMEKDPIFPAEQRIVPIIDGIWPIRVPAPEIYVKQQLFAAGNMLLGGKLGGKEKGYRLMERVIYIVKEQCTSTMLSMLLEKLMMLQKWPGAEERLERFKPMLLIIKNHLEKWYSR